MLFTGPRVYSMPRQLLGYVLASTNEVCDSAEPGTKTIVEELGPRQ